MVTAEQRRAIAKQHASINSLAFSTRRMNEAMAQATAAMQVLLDSVSLRTLPTAVRTVLVRARIETANGELSVETLREFSNFSETVLRTLPPLLPRSRKAYREMEDAINRARHQ